VAKAGHRRGQSLALSAPSFPDTGQRARRFLAAARPQPSPSRPLPIRNFGLCGGFLPRHDLSRPAPDRFETCSPYEVSGPADHMPSYRQKEFTGAGRFGTPPLPAAVRDERSGKLRSDTCLCRCANPVIIDSREQHLPVKPHDAHVRDCPALAIIRQDPLARFATFITQSCLEGRA
jgi:hypothetical protein